MQRPWLILVAGVALATVGYFAVYRTTLCCSGPPVQASGSELDWLRHEFHLSDAEFRRVSELHRAYLPACRERCAQIDAQHAQLRAQIARAGAVTPEAERALAEAAALRRECQTAMLRHFVDVSRAMPPEQGKRYLEWICARTLAPQHDSMAPATAHEHHGM
jgi:hypothetical protein